MLTREQVSEWFDADGEMTDRLMAVQSAGLAHGEAGWYQDDDYSSDADWCYGIGAEIRRIEDALGIDDGSVGDLYSEAHGEGFAKYREKHPED